MPHISPEDVKHLAMLSRVRVDEAEVAGMQEKIGSILAYVEKLQELNTERVPEITNGATFTEGTNPFREDVPVASEPGRLTAAFPRRLGDLMEAPAAITRKE